MKRDLVLQPWMRVRSSVRRITAGGKFAINPHPIFIVGCPRSGTVMLSNILLQSARVSPSQSGEGRDLWERFHPIDATPSGSHALNETDLTPEERAVIHRALYGTFGGKQFVEKKARNSLRVPYLHALFPEAFFICLRRDGRDNVNSLINGWRSDRYHGIVVPAALQISGYGGTNWKFALPPGWRSYIDRPLEDVCAFQWIACNEALTTARAGVPERNWIEVEYEEIVQAPVAPISAVFETLGLPFEPHIERYCQSLDKHPVNYLSPPRLGKWKDENGEAIGRILPTIAPTMARLGYSMTLKPA